MLSPRVVLDRLTAEPFEPFRLRMASGHTYEVRHPEMVTVGRSSLVVHTVDDDDRTRWHNVSLMLLEEIQPLNPPAKQGNGSGS